MKRILLHYPILNTGGGEMSSLRMINALLDRGWSVTLILTTGGGSLEAAIDARAKVIRLRPCAFGSRFSQARGVLSRLVSLPDLVGYGVMRLWAVVRILPLLFRRYDVAAMLLMGRSTALVSHLVRANVRVIWIRNDLAGADSTGKIVPALRRAAARLDYFICVSDVVRKSLIAAVPEAAGKAQVIYNIFNASRMREKVWESDSPFSPPEPGKVSILSVCRLADRPKALKRMVSVSSRLSELGLDFIWYIAGDGPDRAMLEAEIIASGQQSRMRLLGGLDNPFPAYAAADIVAMLSHYEGLSGVVNEARVLGRPVIATRVSGIDEQLTDGINGVVVDNSEDSIVMGLARLISDSALRARIAAGGYPSALLDDEAKLDRLEELFSGREQP